MNSNSKLERKKILVRHDLFEQNNVNTNSTKPRLMPSGSLVVLRQGKSLILTPHSPLRFRPDFELSDVTKNLKVGEKPRPFKILGYKDENNHTRSSTTIINEVKQSYHFISAVTPVTGIILPQLEFPEVKKPSFDLSFLDEPDDILSISFSEVEVNPRKKEDLKLRQPHSTKHTSITEPKSLQSSFATNLRRKSSHFGLSSDRSTKSFQSERNDIFKSTSTLRITTNTIESEESVDSNPPDFNFERSIANTGSFPDMSIGILPITTYCSYCQKEVVTTVKIVMPTLSIWKRICCASFIGEKDLEKYQEIEHNCKNCKRLITRFQPRKL